MRRLLITDDEFITAEGIKHAVDWTKLGISHVFTAYNASQAKEIFGREPIDILLCDIEMPQGNGLQLLEWVREHHPAAETIFLTCHADFHYAKQAIQLGSFDYLLKPVLYADLEAVVKRALQKIDENRRLNEFSQFGKYWMQHQPLLIERFWLDILKQSIPSDPREVARVAEERNIPYSEDMCFLPILIHIRRWHKSYSLRDVKIMEYAIRKSAEEMVVARPESGLVISVGDGFLLVLLNGEDIQPESASLYELSETYIRACRDYFACDVSCYIGDHVRGHETAAMYGRLLALDANNVAYDSKVFRLGQEQVPALASQQPMLDMTVWAAMLEGGSIEKVLAEAEAYIERRIHSGELTPESLNPFLQDVQQTVYYVLQVKGIQAHQLFGDRHSMELSARATRSATDALLWLKHLISTSMTFAADVEHSPNVVDKAIAYIHQHLSDVISREEIASHVFLNPDYLTRLFKKQTGLSISEYVLKHRLNIAAELLGSTDMSISAIASKIGYGNFSHFSRMFKKYMNMNPLEYRQEQQDRRKSKSRESGSERS
ncbi:helix-turn-helix domain-containing protein [Paenibacillus gorillae]|uniref:helix-turn-helix domain-containing protein n=1 Tax=Paenibacillus gorillae TaxID=1243662 RepID=UPI0004AEA3F0|nr:helix-turn-helix domain-containing protein [Paenibacillus gorillae]